MVIKVKKICSDLEISKEEYKSYLVNIIYSIGPKIEKTWPQAKEELLFADSMVQLYTVIVLTDCKDKWPIFFIVKLKNTVGQY